MLLLMLLISNADVAELVDALDLGTSVNDVGVRVPSSAPVIVISRTLEDSLDIIFLSNFRLCLI